MEMTISSLYAIAVVFCLFFSRLGSRHLNHLSLKFFVIYLNLEAVSFAIEWLLLHPDIPHKPFWLSLLMCTTLLTAPCLWLFATESVEKKPPSIWTISIKQRWGLLSGFALLLPVMILPFFEHSSELAKKLISVSVHETMLMAIVFYLLQVPFYLKRCISILNTQTQLNKNTFSNLQDMPLTILKALIWVLSADWLLNILKTLFVMITDGPSPFYLLLALAEVSLLVWAMYMIVSSGIQSDNKTEVTGNANEAVIDVDNRDKKNKSVPGKYANYAMGADALKRIEQKIEKAMSEDSLFKQSSLNLATLCEYIGEYPHYVSQVINQNMNKNFYELVNFYRIQAAKSALNAEREKSILDIALHVGYNSKSTFNTAFKKLTGLTPSQFRASESLPH